MDDDAITRLQVNTGCLCIVYIGFEGVEWDGLAPATHSPCKKSGDPLLDRHAVKHDTMRGSRHDEDAVRDVLGITEQGNRLPLVGPLRAAAFPDFLYDAIIIPDHIRGFRALS